MVPRWLAVVELQPIVPQLGVIEEIERGVHHLFVL
jgi:hypothetical protein